MEYVAIIQGKGCLGDGLRIPEGGRGLASRITVSPAEFDRIV
jgi:hypothetical protein